MWHGAFIGMTGSGKTFAAQQTAASYIAGGRGVLVLRKPLEPWPALSASWQTSDPEAFLWKYERARSCACFMELADAYVSKWDARFHRCFQDGRHYGHRAFYISQRGAQVHPNIRDNCGLLWLFGCTDDAAKTWANEFRDETLLRAAEFPPRWFFYKASRYQPARLLCLAALP